MKMPNRVFIGLVEFLRTSFDFRGYSSVKREKTENGTLAYERVSQDMLYGNDLMKQQQNKKFGRDFFESIVTLNDELGSIKAVSEMHLKQPNNGIFNYTYLRCNKF